MTLDARLKPADVTQGRPQRRDQPEGQAEAGRAAVRGAGAARSTSVCAADGGLTLVMMIWASAFVVVAGSTTGPRIDISAMSAGKSASSP